MRPHASNETHMVEKDDAFQPKLGRIRDRKGRKALPYIRRVLRTAERATGAPWRSRSFRFTGARIGRGRAHGAIAAGRRRQAGQRRVIVKTRLVRLRGADLAAAKAHLRYIQRDGVTPEGEPGRVYDAASDRADGKPFLERSAEDRHQFRFIVSAEDSAELADLKPFIRDLMRQMELDLGTKLDWVAVDHFNTGHPHTHVILRGKDERGEDLVIARDYIAHGMRERASDLVTRELGPQTELDVIRKLEREVEQERFTRLDRAILRDASDGVLTVTATPERNRQRHVVRMGRLRTLERLGLAAETEAGVWRLAGDLESTLRRMGERGDIIKTMHRELTREGMSRSMSDCLIYDPADARSGRLVGRVVARGLSDEINDRHYLIVDAIDGKTHYIDVGNADEMVPTQVGAVVAVAPRQVTARAVDRTAAEIAAGNDGRYSSAIHLRHDPAASAGFVESHVRRLEGMRRAGFGPEREPDGTWIIKPDHLERAATFERAQARLTPVAIETLSTLRLEQQTRADGATWLDRELVAESPTTTRDAGFGREVKNALALRRQWLIEQGLARGEGDRIIYRANMVALLRQRELARVGAQLSGELDLHYVEARPGARIEGVYRRRVDLASGRFALIEKSLEFTLVPWRPVLERTLGKPISGIVRGDTISWTLRRKRSGPSIP
jgi:type IV secretory pathway VirD2 relaxase